MAYYFPGMLDQSKSKYVPRVMKLRLTLKMENMSEEEMNVLHTYGDVKEGIIRTVLVPADMSLHALHYLINQAFGWQNSHLHQFRLPEPIENGLTDSGRLSSWKRLCGVYFRFPADYQDIFWDDDYIEGEGLKTWMRRKYCGPYFNGAKSEGYDNCQREAANLRKEYFEFDVRETFGEMYERHEKTGVKDGPRSKGRKKFDDATIRELETLIYFDRDFCELLEHIQLYQILKADAGNHISAKGAGNTRAEEKEGKGCGGAEEGESAGCGGAEERESVGCGGANDLAFCRLAAERFAMPMPLTDRLEYKYDYGDGWEVSVECVDEYSEKPSDDGEVHFMDKRGTQVLGDALLLKVGRKKKPVCVEADGLPVMDDAGGIHGYVDTLRTIKEPADPDDPDNLREQRNARAWARMMGWTGKKIKTENIL